MTDLPRVMARGVGPRAIGARMAGPGGLYNIGNLFGFLGGLMLHLGAQGSVAGYVVGDLGAALLTLAMMVFCWSGEVYHRAWAGPAPDMAEVRRGDRRSGHGALLPGLGLMAVGEPVLAATAGALHAAGKYGSAAGMTCQGWPGAWPDPWRLAVVASRLPAIALAVTALLAGGGAAPLSLLICYLIWLRADWLLPAPTG